MFKYHFIFIINIIILIKKVLATFNIKINFILDQEFTIKHLPLVDLQQLKVDYGFPTVTGKDCEFIKELFQLSEIIPRSRVQIWISSIDHFLNERYFVTIF